MTEALVPKVWSYCNVLKDYGVGYGDYLESMLYAIENFIKELNIKVDE